LRAAGDPEKSPPPFRVLGNAVLARFFNFYLTAWMDVDFSLPWREGSVLGLWDSNLAKMFLFFSMAQFPLYSARKRRRAISSMLGMHMFMG
jgi:hypothetical protein